MLYDAYNRKIDETHPPPAGALVRWDAGERDEADVSRGLTPELVDRILRDANAGEIEDQARLSSEIEEKNWDIAQALQTRRMAVAAVPWHVEPGAEDDPRAVEIAEAFEAELRAPRMDWETPFDSFAEAVAFELMGALLPGFAVVEIVWSSQSPVGSGKHRIGIAGFQGIEQRHFTFRESARPLLVTRDAPAGVALPAGKFLYHRHRARSGDATRGGLVRPLAWLHVFQQLAGVKDLLRFVERYGMPFLVAKVNGQAWEKDRNRIKHLIQNFGSDGGAVFTDAVTTELLQAANTTGDVYFRLLEYFGDAITRVVLGQTATSGDAGGLSQGQAQENVRMDLVQSDCRAIDATLSAQLARPWTAWNYGPAAPAPRVVHECEEPEDLKAQSEMLMNLANAGLDVDAEEASERFGWTLARRAPAPAAPFGGGFGMPPAAGGTRPPEPPDANAADAAALAGEGAGETRLPGGGAGATPPVPPSWSAPVAALLSEIEARAAEPELSDEQFAAWCEARIAAVPELAAAMDTDGLAEALGADLAAAMAAALERTPAV